MKVPDNLIPLVYLGVVAIIGGAFHWLGVPIELTMLIVGAGLTRVKVSSSNGSSEVKPPVAPPTTE